MTEVRARQRYSGTEILCHDIPVHKRKKKDPRIWGVTKTRLTNSKIDIFHNPIFFLQALLSKFEPT